jgi:hypothetical protein
VSKKRPDKISSDQIAVVLPASKDKKNSGSAASFCLFNTLLLTAAPAALVALTVKAVRR